VIEDRRVQVIVLWQVEQFAAANGAPAFGAPGYLLSATSSVAARIAAVSRRYIQAVVVADVAGSAGRHLPRWPPARES